MITAVLYQYSARMGGIISINRNVMLSFQVLLSFLKPPTNYLCFSQYKSILIPFFLVLLNPADIRVPSFNVFRFKPLQKVDGISDSLCGSSQHCNSTPEQSVAAQSQHHQQYIGKDRSCLFATAPL